MKYPKFTQRLKDALLSRAKLPHPSGGFVEIISCNDVDLRYARQKDLYVVPIANLYEAYNEFCGKTVSSIDLQRFAPQVFSLSGNGNPRNCALFFIILKAMGIITDIKGAGRPHAPFWAEIPLDGNEGALEMDAVTVIFQQLKGLSDRYYELTGRPLSIDELAKFEVVRLLKLPLLAANQYEGDIVYKTPVRIFRAQVRGYQAYRGLKLDQPVEIDLRGDWDEMMFVMFGKTLEPAAIHKVSRAILEAALKAAPGTGNVLTLKKIRALSTLAWAEM